jgi:hypothetical protein
MSDHAIVYEREIFDFSIPVENMSPEQCLSQLQYLDSFHDGYGHSGLVDSSGERVVDLDERLLDLQMAILAGDDLLTKVKCAHYEHTAHGANVGHVLKQVINHLEGGRA